MATAKVTLNNVVLIDATSATAAAADITAPKTAMLANGVVTQGTGSGGIAPTGNINITQAGQTDVTNYATATVASGTEGTPTATKSAVSNHSVTVTPSVTNTEGWITGSTKTGTAVTVTAAELESGTLQIIENDTGISVSGYSAVDVAVPDSNFVVTIGWDDVNELWLPDKTLAEIEEAYLQNIPIVTTSIDQQSVMVTGNCFQDIYSYYVFDGTTLTAYVLYDNGLPQVGYIYDLYDTSDATISSNNQLLNGIKAIGADGTVYTGNIPSKSSSDLTASGATVTVPAGHYVSQASKTVASGTEGVPSAAKGTVSNHSVSVTPSVTNVAGYIAGGTHTGTAVTVLASELVSGSETKTENGTYDVTNLASVVVNVSGGGASGTFSPAENLRSITLSDCVGKKNIAIWPTTSLITGTGRTHYGELWIDGKGLRMVGSSNSGGTGWSLTGGSSQASWDSATGTMTIEATSSSNYGGYYRAGMTYGYHAW